MDENFYFNQERARFEPYEQTCFYCKIRNSKGNETNYFQGLYLEKKRLNLLVYRSVKYNKISIGICRCSQCKSIHDSHNKKGGITYLILGVFAFLIAKFMFEIPTVISIISGAGITYLAHQFFKKKFIGSPQIMTDEYGASQHEFVKEFLNQGWVLDKPTP
jgi:hypothetical protein